MDWDETQVQEPEKGIREREREEADDYKFVSLSSHEALPGRDRGSSQADAKPQEEVGA